MDREPTPGAPSTMDDLIARVAPNSAVISSSNPAPRLRALNVVGLYHDDHAARDAVLALESIESDDAAIGVTVVADPDASVLSDDDGPATTPASPTGPIDELAPRTVQGAAIGALVGAVLIGGVVALIDSSMWIAGAIGGALFGLIVGAIWGAFARMGGSDAYRQTFVETPVTTTTIVSHHSDDPDKADEARRRLALQADAEPTVLGVRDGSLEVLDRPS